MTPRPNPGHWQALTAAAFGTPYVLSGRSAFLLFNEMVDIIAFRDVDGGTELRLVHDRFNTKQSRDGHNAGWTIILDRLTARLPELLAA